MKDIRALALAFTVLLLTALALTVPALTAPAAHPGRTVAIINCPPPGVLAGGEGPGC